MQVHRIKFTVEIDGRQRVVDFLHREKIAALLTADDETLGSWLRALVTEAPNGASDEGSHRDVPGAAVILELRAALGPFGRVIGQTEEGMADDDILAPEIEMRHWRRAYAALSKGTPPRSLDELLSTAAPQLRVLLLNIENGALPIPPYYVDALRRELHQLCGLADDNGGIQKERLLP